MYAIKIMNKKRLRTKSMSKGKSGYDYVLQELKILQTLEHPNVIWLHEIINSPKKDHLYVVTEFHTNGCLTDLINRVNQKY